MPSRAEYRTRSAPRKPSLTKRMIIMLVLVGLLLFLLIGWNVMGQIMMKKAMSSMTAPPQTVTSTKVEFSEWRPAQDAIGTLRAVRGADLAFDVPGLVTRVEIESGQEVDKGDLLIELSADDDRAEVRRLEADAALAKVTFDRAKRQLDANAISKADFDRAAADLEARQAAVAKQKAVVAKKQLRAPFDGRAGIVTVSPGAYLSPGTTVVTLQQLDPVYADFFVPQGQLGKLEVGQKVTLGLDAFREQEFLGELSAIDPKVDQGTRNVRVEAKVPNPDRLLVPGMFANVSVELGEHQRYLTVPQTAVTFNPYGETVFTVVPSKGKDDKGKAKLPTAQQVFVTTGPRRGDQVAILTGIKEGTEIVTSGQLKLKNGTPLIIDNKQAPPNDAHPTPQEK
jgi:membrane fusion protein (multidrug efflux system)